MPDINQLANLTDKVGDAIDKNTESGEERQTALSSRHVVDMNSDSWLSKSVRPIAFLSALFIYLVVMGANVVLAFMERQPIDFATVAGATGLVTTYGGFYFQSRKNEKIARQNAAANIKIAEMKAKADIKQERKEARVQRRVVKREN